MLHVVTYLFGDATSTEASLFEMLRNAREKLLIIFQYFKTSLWQRMHPFLYLNTWRHFLLHSMDFPCFGFTPVVPFYPVAPQALCSSSQCGESGRYISGGMAISCCVHLARSICSVGTQGQARLHFALINAVLCVLGCW